MASQTAQSPSSRTGNGSGPLSLRATGSPADSRQVDPDALMRDISRSVLGRMVIVSLLIHVLIIGGTSVGYISQCFKYGTTDPKSAIAKIEAEKKAKEDQIKADAETKRRAEEAVKARQGGTAAKTPATAEPAATDAPPAAAEAPDPNKPKTPIEKSVEEVDHGKPPAPGANFESPDEL